LQINTWSLKREQANHYFKTKKLLLTALLALLLIPILYLALVHKPEQTETNFLTYWFLHEYQRIAKLNASEEILNTTLHNE
jgi:Cu/Ag efflux pump CusA